jgi:AcrR family transcriptional regulator
MVKVVAEQGYASVDLEDVAERAGVPVQEVSRYYDDKEACFMEAFDLVVARVAAQIAEHVTPGEWPDQIRAGVGAVTELFTAEPGLARVALVEVAAVGPDAMHRYRDALELFHPALERGREYAERGVELPEGIATMALGAAITLLVEESQERRLDAERLKGEMLFALFLPFLGPEQARAEVAVV